MSWVNPEHSPDPEDHNHHLDDDVRPEDTSPDTDEQPDTAFSFDPDEDPAERERRLAELVAQEEAALLAQLDAEQAEAAAAAHDVVSLDALDEPPIDPLADTNPTQPVRPDEIEDAHDGVPMWRRTVGLALLLLAAALTFVAGMIVVVPLLMAEPEPNADATAAAAPTLTTAPADSGQPEGGPILSVQPTLSGAEIAALLATPPSDLRQGDAAIERRDSPFTIIPERSRAEVITYTIQQGDTISAIADQFGLEMDTIAWSNDNETVFALRPGNELYILPVNGAYHQVLTDQSIQSIADQYGVDPYTIINSEYNNLFGSNPERILPSGTRIVVPGGTSTSTDWTYNPVVERSSDSSSGGVSTGGTIAFAPGQPGSCGAQVNPGGSGFFSNPLASYSWVRGFSGYHTGVDLDVPSGTPVYASTPGRVIYRGWNDWGYGYLVVVASGPFTTFYAHLYSFNVSCGQSVGAGQVVGYSGNSGNSSGPHLHFEVRYNDIAVDPTLYVAF